MTIVAGCRFGIAARGGIPKQCSKTVVATITVAEETGARVALPVCQEHYAHFANIKQGTEYTETAKGTPAPKRVQLVKL